MKKIFFVALTLLTVATSCSTHTTMPTTSQHNPKNVILIVGDGMGTAQVYSSVVAQQGDNSQFLRFPYTGFSRTYSKNKYTTDSGAGGSALMTGHKVNNQAIAMSPEGHAHPTLFEELQRKGLATGFVVTCSVLDATPASTYAHVPYRKMYDTISLQMARCGHSVMIGGDRNHFLPEKRHDGTTPLDTLSERGYEMAYSIEALKHCKGDLLCALVSDDSPAKYPERGELLCEGVKKALSMLNRNDKGFALMIEGSQIDWACHNNDSAYLRNEMADFERMLAIVIDFAKRDGNTLVVVTADHETGGLVVDGGNIEKGENNCRFITGGHSGVMVPVFAYGPGAEHFTGIQQNTDIPKKIKTLMGLK